jgi:hypothetical protein
MTDNEVMKALECCMKICEDCDNCPCVKNDYTTVSTCKDALLENVLDLINHLKEKNSNLTSDLTSLKNDLTSLKNDLTSAKAENERLKKGWKADVILTANIKSEAYKEFAERSEKEIFIKQEDERKQMLKILKTYRGTKAYSDTEQATDNWLRGYGEAVQDVLGVFNNLLKELVGDKDVD